MGPDADYRDIDPSFNPITFIGFVGRGSLGVQGLASVIASTATTMVSLVYYEHELATKAEASPIGVAFRPFSKLNLRIAPMGI